MSGKILAIVVTYYPDKQLISNNINAFIENVDKVLIWENTPYEDSNKYRFIVNEKIEYCGDGVNSISKALNFGWKYASDNNYDYLLTMDQDSVWINFQEFLDKTINNKPNCDCVWGPTIVGRGYNEEFHLGDIITSGMLVPVKILNDVGGYFEEFRIDGIDAFFCYSAMEKGYPVYTVAGCLLKQQFGNIDSFSIGKFHFLSYQYNSIRLFEIYKSQIIIQRRFKTTNEYKQNFWKNRILRWPIKIILSEKNKLSKLKAILQGIIAGLVYRIK